MIRSLTLSLAVVAVLAFAASGLAAQKNQMVRGTIKSADPSTGVLVVNQKVGNGVVDRELTITEKAEFVITTSAGTQEVSGKAGLQLLQEAAGSTVQVKCDKDVNVLKVSVTLKK